MDPEPRERGVQTICLLLLSAMAVAAALYWLRPVMVPFVLAVFIAYGLSPLVDLSVRRLRFPRVLAVAGTLALAFLLLVSLGALISASVGQLASNAEAYQAQLSQLLATAADNLPLERFGVSSDVQLDPLSQIPASAVGNMLLGTTNALLDLLSQSILVLIFVIFLLIGSGGRAPLTGVWNEIESNIQRYLATKAALSAATGLLVGLVLSVLGVDLALVFGLFAFLLNFIPSIGSVIATLLPLPVVLVNPEITPFTAVLAIAVPGAIQLTIGNALEPKIMGDTLDLHPVVILIMLIFWGILWGIPGMLLATPITAVMKILFGRLEQTRPLADLLAGRLAPG